MVNPVAIDLEDFNNNGFWQKVTFNHTVNELSAEVSNDVKLEIFQKVGSGQSSNQVNIEEENYVSHTVINPLVDQAFITLQIDELMYIYQGDEVEVTYKVGTALGAVVGGVSAVSYTHLTLPPIRLV